MENKTNIRNELFKRNEMSFELEAEKNPGFDEVSKMVLENVGKPEENIEVYNIKGNFGSNNFSINAYVYDSKEDKDKAEQKTQKQRKAEKEDSKKAAEDAAKPAAPSGVPSEEGKEKKEEPAEESKAPAEEKSEEATKAVEEEKQGEEESKG